MNGGSYQFAHFMLGRRTTSEKEKKAIARIKINLCATAIQHSARMRQLSFAICQKAKCPLRLSDLWLHSGLINFYKHIFSGPLSFPTPVVCDGTAVHDTHIHLRTHTHAATEVIIVFFVLVRCLVHRRRRRQTTVSTGCRSQNCRKRSAFIIPFFRHAFKLFLLALDE